MIPHDNLLPRRLEGARWRRHKDGAQHRLFWPNCVQPTTNCQHSSLVANIPVCSCGTLLVSCPLPASLCSCTQTSRDKNAASSMCCSKPAAYLHSVPAPPAALSIVHCILLPLSLPQLHPAHCSHPDTSCSPAAPFLTSTAHLTNLHPRTCSCLPSINR